MQLDGIPPKCRRQFGMTAWCSARVGGQDLALTGYGVPEVALGI
jgi:hypothetical protein